MICQNQETADNVFCRPDIHILVTKEERCRVVAHSDVNCILCLTQSSEAICFLPIIWFLKFSILEELVISDHLLEVNWLLNHFNCKNLTMPVFKPTVQLEI